MNSNQAAAIEFSVDRSFVREWRKKEADLKTCCLHAVKRVANGSMVVAENL